MAPGQEAEKKGKARAADYANDDRFKAVGNDPRFRRFPKKTTKVQVDERFAGMLKDEAFQTGSKRDKRGGTVKVKDKRKDLKALYDVRSGEQDEEERAAELAEADERWAKMRGIGVASESEESSSEEEEEEELEELQEELSDEDEEDRRAREVFGVGAMAANPQEEINLVENATCRLAAVDLDWAHIKATDILAVLRSFLPAHGRIVRVTVYPSDYGLKRMAEEATVGPQGVWAGAKGDGEQADSDTERRRRRAYELSRLRYYYAIIEFDSAATASKIYEECDGTEFLKSACKFDLRFVPEGQTFEGRQVREVAEDVPADYRPPIFQTMALQSTNPDISWDAPDSNRRQFLNKKLTADEIKEDDFKAYLASGTDESESNSSGEEDNAGPEDAESVRARYRALLLGGGATGVEDKGEDEDEDEQVQKDKEMELQVTFQSGLESLSEKLMAKAARGKKGEAETVWDAYVRRRAEKKAAAQRLGRRNAGSSDEESEDEQAAPSSGTEQEDDPFFQHEENPFDDPFFNDGAEPEKNKGGERDKVRNKKKSGVLSERPEEGLSDAAQKAELEMLLMDDPQERIGNGENELAGSEKKKKKLSMKERIRQRKQARRRDREEGSDEEGLPTGPSAKSLDDPRFGSLLTSSAFALDPTDPRFDARSATLAKKVAERRSRTEAPVPPPLVEEVKRKHDAVPSEKSALQLMVKSLKRKSQKGSAAQEDSKMRRN